jgi:hypothetical protein
MTVSPRLACSAVYVGGGARACPLVTTAKATVTRRGEADFMIMDAIQYIAGGMPYAGIDDVMSLIRFGVLL